MLNEIRYLNRVFVPNNHTLLTCRLHLSGLRFTFQAFADPIKYCLQINPLEERSGTVVFFTFMLNESKQGEPNPYDVYLYYRDDLDIVRRILLTKPNIKFNLTVSEHDDTVRRHLYLNTLIDEVGDQVGVIIKFPTPPPSTPPPTAADTISVINNLTRLCVPRDASIIDRDLAVLMQTVHEHSSLRRLL